MNILLIYYHNKLIYTMELIDVPYNWDCKVQGKLNCDDILKFFKNIKNFKAVEYILHNVKIKFWNFKQNQRLTFNFSIDDKKYTVIIYQALTFQICSINSLTINNKILSPVELSKLIINEFISNIINDKNVTVKKDSIKIISICATHPGINYFYEQNNAYINLEKTAFVLSNVERKEWQIKNCNKKNITIIFNNIKGAMFIYSTGVIQIMGASSIEDVNIMFNEHHNLIPNFIMTNVVKRRKRKIRDIYITPLSFPLIDDELLDELCYELGI